MTNANQMLALRYAKYNGTFDQVFARYQQRIQAQSRQEPPKNKECTRT
jgi:hypothetical protein